MTGKKPDTENEIRIDKEGNWFYNSAPIINRNVFLLFSKSLEKDHTGAYLLRIDQETSPVIVEDTPFVVVDALKDGDVLKIQLNDETQEVLDFGSFYIDKNNVPYCAVKDGRFSARFLRKAYYRITEYFEQDEEDRFFVTLADEKFFVRQEK